MAAEWELASSEYVISDLLEHSYITTAALRRSGCHPADRSHADRLPLAARISRVQKKLQNHLRLYVWMCGDEEPNFTSWSDTEVNLLDQVVFLPQHI